MILSARSGLGLRTRISLVALALAVLSSAAPLSATAAPGTSGSQATASGTGKKSGVTQSQPKKVKKAKAVKAQAPMSVGQQLGLRDTPDALALRSSVALVADQASGELLVAKNIDAVLPIASLTKLMTALVVIEGGQPLDETLQITTADLDREKNTYSRLGVGSKLSRDDMLLLALMSSENRAASALGRHYPGGLPAFVNAMNARARSLGMTMTHYHDANGLSSRNVSTARDLLKLVDAAYKQPLIRAYSTQKQHVVRPTRQALTFGTSNRLLRSSTNWEIGLQKTGFTNEAGRCLVMQTTLQDRPLAMIFLDSSGKLTRYGDASRVRKWIESSTPGTIKVEQRRSPAPNPTTTLSHS